MPVTSRAEEDRRAGAVPVSVLLVEDNETDVFIVQEVLKECGFAFDLHVSTDGENAVSFLESLERGERECPGLVLLDLNIPRLSGIDVLTRIREGSRCSKVPVVVLTSSDSPKDRAATEKLSITAYFRKPTDLKAYMELANVIRAVMGAAEAT